MDHDLAGMMTQGSNQTFCWHSKSTEKIVKCQAVCTLKVWKNNYEVIPLAHTREIFVTLHISWHKSTTKCRTQNEKATQIQMRDKHFMWKHVAMTCLTHGQFSDFFLIKPLIQVCTNIDF